MGPTGIDWSEVAEEEDVVEATINTTPEEDTESGQTPRHRGDMIPFNPLNNIGTLNGSESFFYPASDHSAVLRLHDHIQSSKNTGTNTSTSTNINMAGATVNITSSYSSTTSTNKNTTTNTMDNSAETEISTCNNHSQTNTTGATESSASHLNKLVAMLAMLSSKLWSLPLKHLLPALLLLAVLIILFYPLLIFWRWDSRSLVSVFLPSWVRWPSWGLHGLCSTFMVPQWLCWAGGDGIGAATFGRVYHTTKSTTTPTSTGSDNSSSSVHGTPTSRLTAPIITVTSVPVIYAGFPVLWDHALTGNLVMAIQHLAELHLIPEGTEYGSSEAGQDQQQSSQGRDRKQLATRHPGQQQRSASPEEPLKILLRPAMRLLTSASKFHGNTMAWSMWQTEVDKQLAADKVFADSSLGLLAGWRNSTTDLLELQALEARAWIPPPPPPGCHTHGKLWHLLCESPLSSVLVPGRSWWCAEPSRSSSSSSPSCHIVAGSTDEGREHPDDDDHEKDSSGDLLTPHHILDDWLDRLERRLMQAVQLREEWSKTIVKTKSVKKSVTNLAQEVCDFYKTTADVLEEHHQAKRKGKGIGGTELLLPKTLETMDDLRSVTHVICGLMEEVYKHNKNQQRAMLSEQNWISGELETLTSERTRISQMKGYWDSRELQAKADALLLGSDDSVDGAAADAGVEWSESERQSAGGRRLGTLLTARDLNRHVEAIQRRWLDWRKETKQAYTTKSQGKIAY